MQVKSPFVHLMLSKSLLVEKEYMNNDIYCMI